MESRHEYPITYFWYTKHKGRTIEWIIDHDVSFFIWCLKTFQDITPSQAEYFFTRYGKTIKSCYIQNVEPYTFQKGDSADLYNELCKTRDLKSALFKFREGSIKSLF